MKYTFTEFLGRFIIGGWLAFSAYIRFMNIEPNIAMVKHNYVSLHQIVNSYFGLDPHVSMEVLTPIVSTVTIGIAILEALTAIMILLRNHLYPLILAVLLMIESTIIFHSVFYIKEFRVQYFENVLFSVILVGILFMLTERRKDSENYDNKQVKDNKKSSIQKKKLHLNGKEAKKNVVLVS